MGTRSCEIFLPPGLWYVGQINGVVIALTSCQQHQEKIGHQSHGEHSATGAQTNRAGL
jgi:hypothetical protein